MKKIKFFGIGMTIGLSVVTVVAVAATSAQRSASATPTAGKPLVLVQSNTFQITQAEFVSMAAAQGFAGQKDALGSAEKRQQLLDKMINVNVLAEEAARRGYDKDPEVIAVKKNRLATLMHNRISSQFDTYFPTEAELRSYYEENNNKYNKPEKVRARHILISDQTEAQQLLNQFKQEEVSQYQFRKIAKEKSEDLRTKAKGGDLAFLTRNTDDSTIPAKVVEAAFQIKTNGGLYPQLVQTRKGFHLVMRTGYRKAMNRSFEEAKDQLIKLVQRKLHKQKTEQAINALQQKYKVELYEENLKHVVIDLTKASTGRASAMPQRRRMRRE